jgi:AraC family transcriptional regulator of adaptative response / DNA-3-methyladenine glycosylase II
LAEDAVLGPVVRRRPGVRAPGVWTPFEAAVAVAFPDLAGELARTYGVLVPGLGYGLTHVFPSAELLAETSEPVAELAKSMAAGEEPRGVDAAAEQHIALRLGARDAFPATDPTVRRTVNALGADPQRWRPWRSLATVHLLLRG